MYATGGSGAQESFVRSTVEPELVDTVPKDCSDTVTHFSSS